ncbi:MAG TPA: S8 family serine peptidase [Thermoanaerobaculia bacterium]|jgi:hypothetical protein
MVRKLFASLLVAFTVSANEVSFRSLQSGPNSLSTPLHDRGLHGENQIIAILDTGLGWDNCYFLEPDGSAPPYNTGSPTGGLDWENVDHSRRKVIAYNYLYSCDQYPGAKGCEEAGAAGSFDNQGHGTHAASAALGDKGAAIAHDYADAIAPGAKLVVQDAGFIGGDNCSHRPGIGCPVQMLPILEQAYKQGARIHSNSWGDRQNTGPSGIPPTANYPASARDVDAFVHDHPDMLVIFNTGNWGSDSKPAAGTVSAPGSAKNALQIGGTRAGNREDDVLAGYSLFGPTKDGRIKPDLVGPARVIGGDIDFDKNPNTCDMTRQSGTSWSSPSVAGAAALARQYYTEGFYPTGARNAANAFTPSAALLKATLIASARRVPYRREGLIDVDTLPVPSNEQGWGFPVLDDALHFAGEARKLRVYDVPRASGLAKRQPLVRRFRVQTGTPFKVVLVWTDPPGNRAVNATVPQLMNDLDLVVTGPDGTRYFGNGANDDRNTVETVAFETPSAGQYAVQVGAEDILQGERQGYALVIVGDVSDVSAGKSRSVRH